MIWIYNHSRLDSLVRMKVCILLLQHMDKKDAKFSPISKLCSIATHYLFVSTSNVQTDIMWLTQSLHRPWLELSRQDILKSI